MEGNAAVNVGESGGDMCKVGENVGGTYMVGDEEGVDVVSCVGMFVGMCEDGESEGSEKMGKCVGMFVGISVVGVRIGADVGKVLGELDVGGFVKGDEDGSKEGKEVCGPFVGRAEGVALGAPLGSDCVGTLDGSLLNVG